MQVVQNSVLVKKLHVRNGNLGCQIFYIDECLQVSTQIHFLLLMTNEDNKIIFFLAKKQRKGSAGSYYKDNSIFWELLDKNGLRLTKGHSPNEIGQRARMRCHKSS